MQNSIQSMADKKLVTPTEQVSNQVKRVQQTMKSLKKLKKKQHLHYWALVQKKNATFAPQGLSAMAGKITLSF